MLIILGGIYFVPPLVAGATTDTVTNCNNSGTGSLRQTMADAAPGDTINFALSPTCSTILDTTGTMLITKNLTLDGPGASGLSVSGDSVSELFDVYPGVVASISGLTIEDGSASLGGGVDNSGNLTITNSTLSGNSATSGNGGGIWSGSGTLAIMGSTLSNNSATSGNGGGIYSGGTTTITNSTLSGNSANNGGGSISNFGGGGGIYSTSSLGITGSTVSNNTASVDNVGYFYNDGGGIFTDGGVATITDTTVSANSVSTSTVAGSVSSGGGIYSVNGSLSVTASTVTDNTTSATVSDSGVLVQTSYGAGIDNGGTGSVSNSTVAGNSGAIFGGGIYNDGTVTVSNSTVAGNSATTGGGIYNVGTVNLLATIVASSGGADCSGGIIDQGYNIDDDGSCGFALPSISDYSTLDLTLGPLANNGGPDPDHRPATG